LCPRLKFDKIKKKGTLMEMELSSNEGELTL